MATKTCSCALFLAVLLVAGCSAQQQGEQLGQTEARQCRVRQFSASRPSRRIESEGGVTELWDDNEDQMLCAGASARKHTIRPQSMTVPSFHNSPGLAYIAKGRGVFGLAIPGCPETHHSSGEQSFTDRHQKLRRIQQGDIVTIPSGVTNWCFNDGNEELVAVTIFDVTNQANQLRSSLLAGGAPERSTSSEGEPKEQYERQGSGYNIFRGLDTESLADVFNIPRELAARMQSIEKNRGYIVRVHEEAAMHMLRPEGEEERMQEGSQEETGYANEGMAETLCNLKARYNLDNPAETDVFSRRTGRLKSVTALKLPMLQLLDLSAEKGNLRPGAMVTPHWLNNAHKIVYVTRGQLRLQMVDNQGRTVFNDRVGPGELIVVPQYYVCMKKAGSDGGEWVSFKKSSMPVRSPVFGRASVINAMPLPVLANSFGMSLEQARELKFSPRQQLHMMLFPPSTSTR